mmetsp:Transcript_29320/g.59042  ORF Transcript_29320/g.59042 Transcript_29320/m.59042 type:complete len:263 (+) Transcript_29320:160-948(+)
MTATRLFLTAAAVMLSSAAAFNTIQPRMIATRTQTNNKSSVASLNNNNEHQNHFTSKPIVSTLTALSIFATLSTTPLLPNSAANAYEESDYASETVTTVVQRLKSSTGSIDDTFLALEDVAKIITEGKGVGGQLTYDGVKLNEGYVADEDTTIYNPGLSLLTESEKERLTDAIIQNRKVSLSSNQWNENNEYAFKFLKQKLDPLHMYELGGYLKILPFWGAALYLGALFVQQNSRGIFPLVYGLCALGVFGPVIVLVAFGGP